MTARPGNSSGHPTPPSTPHAKIVDEPAPHLTAQAAATVVKVLRNSGLDRLSTVMAVPVQLCDAAPIRRIATDADAARVRRAAERQAARNRKRLLIQRRDEVRQALEAAVGAGNPGMSEHAVRLEALRLLATAADAETRARILRTADGEMTGEVLDWRVEEQRDLARRMARDARFMREAVIERLVDGLRWHGGSVGGLYQEPFVFHGLKSADHPWIAEFVRCCPKAKSGRGLQTANGKEILEGTDSKLLSMDDAYAEGNKIVRGFLRIDTDREWPSAGALAYAIAGAGLPMPHLAVGDILPNGKLIRPHLIYFLPRNSGIRFGPGALEGPMRLWKATMKALVGAFLPIGADPGGLANPMRCKNPVSPHQAAVVLSEAAPLSVGDLARHEAVEPFMAMGRDELERRYIATLSEMTGIPAVTSNEAFDTFRRAALNAARTWTRLRDPRARLRGEDLSAALFDELRTDAAQALGNGAATHRRGGRAAKQAYAILRRVCDFLGRNFDPDALVAIRPNAGALYGTLTGGLKDRQAAGGAYAARQRRDASVEILVTALKATGTGDAMPTKSSIASSTGLAYRTVLRHWDAAVLAVFGDCDRQSKEKPPSKARPRLELKPSPVIKRSARNTVPAGSTNGMSHDCAASSYKFNVPSFIAEYRRMAAASSSRGLDVAQGRATRCERPK